MGSGLPISVLSLALASSIASAAPPKLNALFPAGASRGTTVTVTASGTFGKWPVKTWVDRPGVELSATADKGKLTVQVAADAEPGTYWFRLYDDDGAAAPRPFQIGILPELNEAEPNDDRNKPQKVDSLPVVMNGRLDKNGDVDTFAVSLRAGQTLVASVDANRTLGSPMDSILQIVTPGGNVLAENDEYYDLDSQIVFAVPADGVYLIRMFGFPATPTATIGFAGGEDFVYRLTITTDAFAEYAFPLSVTAAAAQPGDAKSPETDQFANVELRGWNIPEALKNCAVARGKAGQPIVVFHPQVAGIATVRCEPHATIVEQEPNGSDTPQEIQLPVTISGRIDKPHDVDVFRFNTRKGDKLAFRVESRALGFPLDPLLRMTDRAGKTLAEVDDSGGGRDAELAFTVPDDGEYRVIVRDLHGHGGDRYVYRLTAAIAQPDFSLKVAADSFVIQPGKPLEIPVTIDRLNGLATEIEITAEGLPEGVTAMAAKSAGSGDSAKSIKLSLSATAMAAGPFRIVGRTVGESQLSRSAVATVSNATISDLWLTVTKSP